MHLDIWYIIYEIYKIVYCYWLHPSIWNAVLVYLINFDNTFLFLLIQLTESIWRQGQDTRNAQWDKKKLFLVCTVSIAIAKTSFYVRAADHETKSNFTCLKYYLLLLTEVTENGWLKMVLYKISENQFPWHVWHIDFAWKCTASVCVRIFLL